jgi:hypothetical protein
LGSVVLVVAFHARRIHIPLDRFREGRIELARVRLTRVVVQGLLQGLIHVERHKYVARVCARILDLEGLSALVSESLGEFWCELGSHASIIPRIDGARKRHATGRGGKRLETGSEPERVSNPRSLTRGSAPVQKHARTIILISTSRARLDHRMERSEIPGG